MAVGIGIELTTDAVRGVILEGSAAGGLRIRALQELACDTTRADALTNTLAQLRRELGIRQPVVLGLPSTSVIVQTVTPLVASVHRASLGVAFELQQSLPFDLPDVTWDYRWLVNGAGRSRGPLGLGASAAGIGGDTNALVAAVRRQVLDERLASCQRAGLAVAAVSVNPVAAWNSWSWAAKQRPVAAGAVSGTVLLHHVSDELVEWILSSDKTFRVLPLAVPTEPAALAQTLRGSWEAFKAELPQLPGRCWVLAAPAATARLQQALSSPGGPEMVPFDPTEALTANPERSELARAAAAAMGLALQGLGAAGRPLNFLAASQRERLSRQVTRAGYLAAGLCAAVAILWTASALLEMRSRRAAVLVALSERETQYVALRPDIRAQLQQQEELSRRVEQLEAVAAARSALTRLVARFSEAMPETVWLTKIDCSKNGGIVGMLEGRGKSFQDVTQFLDRLKQVPGVVTVKPLSTTVATDPASGKEQIVFAAQLTGTTHPTAAPAGTPEPSP